MTISIWLICVLILNFTRVHNEGKIQSLNGDRIQNLLAEEETAVILFYDDNMQSKIALSVFKSFNELRPSWVYLECHTSNTEFEGAHTFMGVAGLTLPQIILHTPTAKYLLKKSITQNSLVEFQNQYEANELEQHYKSAQYLVENLNAPVQKLSSKFFESTEFLKSDKEYFVKLFVPWCGHCKALNPTWQELGKRVQMVNPNLIIAEVDANLNEIKGIENKKYPSLLFFTKDKELPPIEYTDGRSLKQLETWLQIATEHPWIPLDDPLEFEDL